MDYAIGLAISSAIISVLAFWEIGKLEARMEKLKESHMKILKAVDHLVTGMSNLSEVTELHQKTLTNILKK